MKKINKIKLSSILISFLMICVTSNVNAAYRCGTLHQNANIKTTSNVSSFGKDADYYEYLSGAGSELNGAVFCSTPTKTYTSYNATCEDVEVNLYKCVNGKDAGRCGQAKAFQKYIESSMTYNDYFKTMYRNRYFLMQLNNPNMSIWEMRKWNNPAPVYKNTYNNSGKYKFTSGLGKSVRNEYYNATKGNYKNYSKSVWYSKAEKWTVSSTNFKTVAKDNYATVTIDTKNGLNFSKYSSLPNNAIVLTGKYMSYFKVSNVKGKGSKITFRLTIKSNADKIADEISKNKNLSKVLQVQVNFKDKRDIKAIVNIKPTNYQSWIQLYKKYKVKSVNVSCGSKSEAKNNCPGVPTGSDGKTCTDYKTICEKNPTKNKKECNKYYSKDCCDDLKKACEKDPTKNKKDCETYDNKCVLKSNRCNLTDDEINKDVIVSSNATGEFNADVYNKIVKHGNKRQLDSYLKVCKCNCNSTAADINTGACEFKSGGTYDENKYKEINDSNKDKYLQHCSPCDFNKNNVKCEFKEKSGNCKDDTTATLTTDYSETQLEACASTGGGKYSDTQTFGSNLPALCYENYTIQYNETTMSTGINTSIGFTKYLKFNEGTDSDNGNTIKITTSKVCYVKGDKSSVENSVNNQKNKSNSPIYSNSPSVAFDYAEEISNDGFDSYKSENVGSVVENTSNSGVQKVTSKVTYVYRPSTEYYVDIYKGNFYYYSSHKSDFKDNVLTRLPESNNFNEDRKLLNKIYSSDEIKQGIPGKDIENLSSEYNTIKSIARSQQSKVFPIKFTTQPNEAGQAYEYNISISNYNFGEKSLNNDFKNMDECKNTYTCNYTISKKDCSKIVDENNSKQHTFICNIPEDVDLDPDKMTDEQKAETPYCSEVYSCAGDNDGSKVAAAKSASPINFTSSIISTDKVLGMDENSSSKTLKSVGANWQTEKGQQTIKDIEEASKKGETYSDKNLVYEVSLGQDDILELRSEIKANGYVNKKGIVCTKIIPNSQVYYCASEFLEEQNESSYGKITHVPWGTDQAWG